MISEVWDGYSKVVHSGVQARGSEAGERAGREGCTAARDLGIGENVLGRWVREAASGKGSAFPGRGVMKAEDAELAQLRKELARTKAERDILKKAIAFFAKDPP